MNSKSTLDNASPANSAGIPSCAAPDPNPNSPRLKLPPLSCDCHAHICGPAARYSYSHERTYTPPDALLPQYEHMLAKVGIERAVLVQPSVYGTDNTVMIRALKAAGERFRGVAVIADDATETELASLHRAGVRGARVNVVDVKDRKKGTLPMVELERLALKIKPLGWHLEFLMHVDEFPDLYRMFGGFPVDTVYGHLGYMKTAEGLDAAGFQALLRLLSEGRAWVKLTGPYRISSQPLPYPDTNVFARALIEAAPKRVVWGSDWPHVRIASAMPNDAALVDLLSAWMPSADALAQVMVKNPELLYGFATGAT